MMRKLICILAVLMLALVPGFSGAEEARLSFMPELPKQVLFP